MLGRAATTPTTATVPVPRGNACTPLCRALPVAPAVPAAATPAIWAAAAPVTAVAAAAAAPVTPAVPTPAAKASPEVPALAAPEAVITTATLLAAAAAAFPALVPTEQVLPQVPAASTAQATGGDDKHDSSQALRHRSQAHPCHAGVSQSSFEGTGCSLLVAQAKFARRRHSNSTSLKQLLHIKHPHQKAQPW
jgi:hypothetical protein